MSITLSHSSRNHQVDHVYHQSQTYRTLRGTTNQFLLHFKEQLRLLYRLVPHADQLPDFTRPIFLQQAVEAIPDLRKVRIIDGLMRTKGAVTTSLAYSSYMIWSKMLHCTMSEHLLNIQTIDKLMFTFETLMLIHLTLVKILVNLPMMMTQV